MRFLVALLFVQSLSAQWVFTKYYAIDSDPDGAINITEYDTLSGSLESITFDLDRLVHCVPTWVQVNINFDANGALTGVDNTVIPPFERIAINPKITDITLGYAMFNPVDKSLEIFSTDTELAARVLQLYSLKPCNSLAARSINVSGVTNSEDYFITGQAQVSVTFSNDGL